MGDLAVALHARRPDGGFMVRRVGYLGATFHAVGSLMMAAYGLTELPHAQVARGLVSAWDDESDARLGRKALRRLLAEPTPLGNCPVTFRWDRLAAEDEPKLRALFTQDAVRTIEPWLLGPARQSRNHVAVHDEFTRELDAPRLAMALAVLWPELQGAFWGDRLEDVREAAEFAAVAGGSLLLVASSVEEAMGEQDWPASASAGRREEAIRLALDDAAARRSLARAMVEPIMRSLMVQATREVAGDELALLLENGRRCAD